MTSDQLLDERQYSRISHPAHDAKQERNTNTKDRIKYKTIQAKIKEDSSSLDYPQQGDQKVKDRLKADEQ